MAPFTLNWGIIATGWISECFVKDLLEDPASRGVGDVAHKIVAVGSRTVEKAQEFVKEKAKNDTSIKAYGTYEEVYADKDVQAIYIGTPHTYHYENAMDAIKAGKHVLCEKPVTCNSAELRSLLAAAKEQNVFFMEALWTRFHPLTQEVKKIIDEGKLGLPLVVHADLSGDFNIENIPKTHRILDPALGGGALLDLGPYPLIWAILALYEHPNNKRSKPASISGSMLMTPLTNVDRNTSFTINFDSPDFSAQAVLSCSINVSAQRPGVSIRCQRGFILVDAPIYSPRSFTVQEIDKDGKVIREEKRNFEYVGKGWHFQADDVARCVRDGKIENELWSHDKSLLEMNIFDEVRRQGGYRFPPGIEKVAL